MVFLADDVLRGAMVALDFALSHGMERLATNVDQLMLVEEGGQVPGQEGWAIVGRQTAAVMHLDMLNPREGQSRFQDYLHIVVRHRAAQLLGQDVA